MEVADWLCGIRGTRDILRTADKEFVLNDDRGISNFMHREVLAFEVQ